MLTRFLARLVRARMQGLQVGRLFVQDGDRLDQYGPGGSGPRAGITILDRHFYRAIVLGGHIGAAESYVRGEWETEDLPELIRLFAANRAVLDGLETGLARLSRPALAAARRANRNTRSGSDRNIRAHYDLGNEFFAQFLDETMTYSAGIFEHADATMKDASVAKYDRLCRQLDLSEKDHVIEIGTGWGGFAIHAATAYGCRVTTTTISREQHALATRHIDEAGLSEQVTLLLEDYRDLEGQYDKLVSIEMVEAVGHQYLDLFFETCARLLVPGGQAAIQVITILDEWYDPQQRQVDFIKKYIFPGSFIPSMGALRASSSRTSLSLLEEADLTPHYAETLKRWRLRFEENWPTIQAMGFDGEFRRLWLFYLAYCEGGFDEGVLRSKQLLFGQRHGAESSGTDGEHRVVEIPRPREVTASSVGS
jgi:cyclopropane-fatty-acyl-phospholipid synthase